jgi:glycerol-3-phosphate dehydrogenase
VTRRDADVAVVGGGVTGCGVARDLAMRGLDVVLLERDALDAGTSGRSHGLLHSGARYAMQSPEGARHCLEENRVLRAIAPHCLDETGGVLVALPDDDRAHAAEKVKACREIGMEVAADGNVARPPGLADGAEVVAGVPDAVVYPTRLVAATALDAADRGAEIVTAAQVTGIGRSDGSTRVIVDDGAATYVVDHAVLAAGAWTGALAGSAGARVAMEPTAGTMVTVEYPDLEVVLNRARPPSDGDIAVPHPATAVLGTTSEPVDDPDDVYDGAGRSGGTGEPGADRRDAAAEAVVAECGRMLPALADAPVQRVYRGVRPLYSPYQAQGDRSISRDVAVLRHGERDDVPGLTSVVGGKLTTHRLMAERAADAVCDGLGVEAPCRTAEEPLPGAEGDGGRVRRFAREHCAPAPADADVTSF